MDSPESPKGWVLSRCLLTQRREQPDRASVVTALTPLLVEPEHLLSLAIETVAVHSKAV
jgi:hypothetical protein